MCALASWLFLANVPAEARQERVESLSFGVFTMTHQPAREAMALVDPLLSPAGSMSLQQEDNALVIKDRASVLEKLRSLLAEFDHPKRELVLELYLLRASREQGPSGGTLLKPDAGAAAEFPSELVAMVAELGNILSLNSYQALGSAKLRVAEGQLVNSTVGSLYQLSFDVGTVLRSRYLKLSDFRVQRPLGSASEPVYHSNVNLELARPSFIVVSRDAASDSGLVVAFLWRPIGEPPPSISPLVPGAR